MPGFEINGVPFGVGQRTLRISGVGKGPGTTVGINGFLKDNTVPGPDLVPITLGKSFPDAFSACTVGLGAGTENAFIDKRTGTIYSNASGTTLWNGNNFWWATDFFTPDPPYDIIFINDSGSIAELRSCSAV